MKDIYQDIYEKHDWYGDSSVDRCPGVRLIPLYKDHIKGKVIDLGCGRGDTVRKLRDMGFDANGIDQIDLKNEMMIGSVTDDIDLNGYGTALCIDVIEHLNDNDVGKLFANFTKCERQIFSIHNVSHVLDGIELHINLKSFYEWEEIIRDYFVIEKIICVRDMQMLYWTVRR